MRRDDASVIALFLLSFEPEAISDAVLVLDQEFNIPIDGLLSAIRALEEQTKMNGELQTCILGGGEGSEEITESLVVFANGDPDEDEGIMGEDPLPPEDLAS